MNLYPIRQVSEYVGVTTLTIKKWSMANLIPQPVKVGANKAWHFNTWQVRKILEYADAMNYPIRWVLVPYEIKKDRKWQR